MFEILNFVIDGVAFGVSTAILTSMLDFAMDFGHVLGAIRYKKAKRICDKLNMPALLKKFDEGLNNIVDFTERLEYADTFYYKLAAIHNPFTVWICKICMGFRINFVLVFLIAIIGVFAGQDILGMLNVLIISILANFFFLKKII